MNFPESGLDRPFAPTNIKESQVTVTIFLRKCKTNPNIQCALMMVEQDFAIVTPVRQMILENVFAAKSDVSPELLPAGQADEQGGLESLHTRNQQNRTFERSNVNKPCSKQTFA